MVANAVFSSAARKLAVICEILCRGNFLLSEGILVLSFMHFVGLWKVFGFSCGNGSALSSSSEEAQLFHEQLSSI